MATQDSAPWEDKPAQRPTHQYRPQPAVPQYQQAPQHGGQAAYPGNAPALPGAAPGYPQQYAAQYGYAAPPKRSRAWLLAIIIPAVIVLGILGLAAIPLITSRGVSSENVNGWMLYNSPVGKYEVRLPKEPVASSKAAGGGSDLMVFGVDAMYKNRNFGAAYFDLGSDPRFEYTFDYVKAAQGMASASGATVTEQRSHIVSGRTGWMVKFKNRVPGFFNKAYMVRDGNRVYIVLAEAYRDDEEPVIDTFLNSFRITG